jgi:hypothetical protein
MRIRSLLLLLTSGCALAQLVNGSMTGVVTDTSGSRIPKAKLMIAAEATGALRAATSTQQRGMRGAYNWHYA